MIPDSWTPGAEHVPDPRRCLEEHYILLDAKTAIPARKQITARSAVYLIIVRADLRRTLTRTLGLMGRSFFLYGYVCGFHHTRSRILARTAVTPTLATRQYYRSVTLESTHHTPRGFVLLLGLRRLFA